MIDQILAIGLSNTCLALLLAIVAMFTEARTKRPQLAHLLWLLVLIKLVTPPVVSIPLHAFASPPETTLSGLSSENAAPVATFAPALADSLRSFVLGVWNAVGPWLGIAWLLGSGIVVGWSLTRVLKFDRVLRAHTQPAPPAVLAAADDVARCFGLRSSPVFCFTTANISPMVWWIGGRVRVVIPSSLLEQLETHQLRWVVAHELAHVYRRDYLVRWLEWLAGACFWWNPLVWLARRNLRALEEICCDALVIATLRPEPHTYASSILTAIESLARPILRPPAMASEINSGGFLERRFSMMIFNRAILLRSRWQQSWVLLCGIIVLPLGIAYAQDYNAVGKRLKAAVASEEITEEQARTMMGALKRTEADHDSQHQNASEDHAVAKKLRAIAAREKADDDDAQAKLPAFRKKTAGKDDFVPAQELDLDRIKKKIKSGVERDDITRDKAEANPRKIKPQSDAAEGKKKDKSSDFDADLIKQKLKAGMERGDLSRAEAEAQMRSLMLRSAEEKAEKEKGESDKALSPRKKLKDSNDLKKLKAGIEQGDLSRDDAESKIRELKQPVKTGEGKKTGKNPEIDWDTIKKKIESAVERHEITRGEADAIYSKLKQ